MIQEVEYHKCRNCGFTFSPTIYDLSEADFSRLNIMFHKWVEDYTIDKTINQPPYLEQVTMLKVLESNGLIDLSLSLDFAGGLGTLSKIIKKYFDMPLFLIFDPYMQDTNNLSYINKNQLEKYKTVFNSAFFEHITKRESIEDIDSCVAENGVLIIHTVICETIPLDPNWFYINPVHCSFHTNRSMDLLMKQLGYSWSIYCPSAKSWVLFKKKYDNEEKIVNRINREFQVQYLFYNPVGFVDYWKGF